MHQTIAQTTNAHRTGRGRAAATDASPIHLVIAPTTADLQLAAPHAMVIHAPPVMLIAVALSAMPIPALNVMLIPVGATLQGTAQATLQVRAPTTLAQATSRVYVQMTSACLTLQRIARPTRAEVTVPVVVRMILA